MPPGAVHVKTMGEANVVLAQHSSRIDEQDASIRRIHDRLDALVLGMLLTCLTSIGGLVAVLAT